MSLSRTSTNQSIASSISSKEAHSSAVNSTISPSSSSSLSASSSVQQIAPVNSSSPRSRNASPNCYSQMNTTANIVHPKSIISPSGLLTDGPLGRRPVISPSPLRDRSTSPVFSINEFNSKKIIQQQQSQQKIINQINVGSNTNLHSLQDNKTPSTLNSPMINRKQGVPIRKSFLPQPVQFQQPNRQASVSPLRNQQQHQHVSPSWKDGCY